MKLFRFNKKCTFVITLAETSLAGMVEFMGLILTTGQIQLRRAWGPGGLGPISASRSELHRSSICRSRYARVERAVISRESVSVTREVRPCEPRPITCHLRTAKTEGTSETFEIESHIQKMPPLFYGLSNDSHF